MTMPYLSSPDTAMAPVLVIVAPPVKVFRVDRGALTQGATTRLYHR